ncbi:MAG: sulfatase-like hydrolase/transferase [bacterium]|nr:sulfatase-like hydrolase/transferase [bacterium]
MRQKSIIIKVMILTCLAVLLLVSGCSKRKVPEKKQIIFLSIDTLRGDHLSSLKYFRDTSSSLSNLIKDSVYYPQAYPNGCWTMPSHMSMLTGTLPSRHGINKSWKEISKGKYPKLNESVKNIAEILEAHDKNINTLKLARLPIALGFANGYDKNLQMDPLDNKSKLKKLLKTIEDNKDNDFFMFLHTWKVHSPYSSPIYLEKGRLTEKELFLLERPGKIKVPEEKKKKKMKNKKYNSDLKFRFFLKEADLFNPKDCITLYDGSIFTVDRYVGRIVEKCKKLGIYDDVIFIVTSDHGEHFAEHFPKQFYNYHGHDFYEEFIKVPLIIKYPKGTIEPATLAQHPVSLIDLVPTILDLYQIDIPHFVQGESLLKPTSKRRKQLLSEATSSGEDEIKMIRVGDLKYMVTMSKPFKKGKVNWENVTERRLFDLKKDPLEKTNLYLQPKFKGICINFEKMLKKLIKQSASTNLTTKHTTVDQETLDQMEALGYL